MSQGNCTLCTHAHMQEQLGEMQRICRKGLSEQMICDVFEAQPVVVS